VLSLFGRNHQAYAKKGHILTVHVSVRRRSCCTLSRWQTRSATAARGTAWTPATPSRRRARRPATRRPAWPCARASRTASGMPRTWRAACGPVASDAAQAMQQINQNNSGQIRPCRRLLPL